MIEFERILQNVGGERERVHSGLGRRGVAGVFEPLDDGFGPADAEVRGGDHFERGAPTVEGEAESLSGDGGQDAARGGVAALADDVHLNVIDAAGEDQVHVAGFAGLVFAAGDGDVVEFLQAAVGFVVVGRQGFFEPGDAVVGEFFGKLIDGGGDVVAIAHAPPGVGVDHEIEIGADGFAHLADGFDVLFGAHAGSHLVGHEAEFGDGGGFFGVALGRHVHAGGTVEADAIADTAADEFRDGEAESFAEGVVEGDFDASSRLWRGRGPGRGRLRNWTRRASGSARVRPVRNGAMTDSMAWWAVGLPWPGRVADEAGGGFDADEHGVAFEDGAFASVVGEFQGLGEAAGEEEGPDAGNSHNRVQMSA